MSSSFDRSRIGNAIRRLLGIDTAGSDRLRRTSRRDRDQQNTRMLIAGLAVVAVLAIVTVVGGLVFENIVKPNTVLATVGDEEITRQEYWKYQAVQLYRQADEYQEFASQVEGEQRTQFLSFAASFRAQAAELSGSTDISEVTLTQMVDDQLYLHAAETMDMDLSDEAVEAFTLQQFAPEGVEIVTPYPEPTLIPERAVWATETAEAIATPVVATPQDAATPVVVASPDAEGTPSRDASIAEATNAFSMFQSDVFGDADITLDEYNRLVARPLLARDLVTSSISNEVPQTSSQVKASHILVSTEDLARELRERTTSGADFAELARTNSVDDATAPTGGDLGWFTEDQMVDPFADAAFSLAQGEISEPVQTEFGWHLIKVEASDENRALTDLQYQQAQDAAVQAYISDIRSDTDIEADVPVIPTPSPTPSQFSPPANAPTPVPATPIPATPAATPVEPVGGTPIVEGPYLITPEPED